MHWYILQGSSVKLILKAVNLGIILVAVLTTEPSSFEPVPVWGKSKHVNLKENKK